MSYDSDLADAFARPEKFDCSKCVVGEIGCCCRCEVASGLCISTVVVAKRGYTVACKIVGDYIKWFVVEQLLVAVLSAAAADKYNCWYRLFLCCPIRNHQSSSKGDASARVGENCVDRFVWEWRLRCLGALYAFGLFYKVELEA